MAPISAGPGPISRALQFSAGAIDMTMRSSGEPPLPPCPPLPPAPALELETPELVAPPAPSFAEPPPPAAGAVDDASLQAMNVEQIRIEAVTRMQLPPWG